MRTGKHLLLSFSLLLLCIQELPAAESPKDPIRIGASVSMEGKYHEPSMMIKHAYRLWAEEINRRGGLLGREVELILYDDKSLAERTRSLYQKLIEKDRVDLVFSPYGTPLTLAASEVSEKHGLVMLACAASGEKIWERGFQYVFGVYAPARRYFIGLLDIMARSGRNQVSLVYDVRSPFGTAVAEGAKKWSKRFRIDVVQEKPYANDETELDAIVSDLRDANAQNVIVAAYPPDCHHILTLMRQKEYKPGMLGMTIAPVHPDFKVKAGDMANRVFAPSQWEPKERIPFPGTKQFVSAFKRFTDKTPSYHAGSAYAACQLYEAAVRQAQTLDNEKIRHYISGLDTVTIIGRFKVDASGKQIGHNPIVIQWQNGSKEIVWPFNMQTAPPLLSSQ